MVMPKEIQDIVDTIPYPSNSKINEKYTNHKEVWIKQNGPIPSGYVIHHIDGDVKNNNIDNLECLDKSIHRLKHTRSKIVTPWKK